MRAWLYCISSENHSCNGLRIIRQEARRFANERRMQVLGTTSINLHQSLNIENMIASAVESEVDVLVVSNIYLLSKLQKFHMHKLCLKNRISIVYATWKGTFI